MRIVCIEGSSKAGEDAVQSSEETDRTCDIELWLNVAPALTKVPGVDIVAGPDYGVDHVLHIVQDDPSDHRGSRDVMIPAVINQRRQREDHRDERQSDERDSFGRGYIEKWRACLERGDGEVVRLSLTSIEAKHDLNHSELLGVSVYATKSRFNKVKNEVGTRL